MIRLAVIFMVCLFSACLNHEKDSRDLGDSVTLSIASHDQEDVEPVERLITFIPNASPDLGLLLIWEGVRGIPHPHTAPDSRTRNPGKAICHFAFRLYNFSDYAEIPPQIDTLGLHVSIHRKCYPLLPLSAFASEFIHEKTLSLLDGNYPAGGLQGRSWTQVYLACCIEGAEATLTEPDTLCLQEGKQQPWISVNLEILEAFLQKPSRKGFEEMAGITRSAQSEPSNTE